MNENIQILTTYNPFVITGIVLSCLWAGAYILSWLIQWAWAWVDEGKISSNNQLIVKLFGELPKNYIKLSSSRAYNYAKIDDSGRESDLRDTSPNSFKYLLLLPLIWFSMLCLNFWYISMWFGMAYAVAFTMRMARRGQKILTKHINDKDAHK